ncbi:MAG: hypothetical protein ACI91O_000244 [Candidatus Poriferisodalaceae bacterium]|jgi:hypothetical protein
MAAQIGGKDRYGDHVAHPLRNVAIASRAEVGLVGLVGLDAAQFVVWFWVEFAKHVGYPLKAHSTSRAATNRPVPRKMRSLWRRLNGRSGL